MTITEQALCLLDILPSIKSRRLLENFLDMDRTVIASLEQASIEPIPDTTVNMPYSVASRLNRSNYEDQAKSEALMKALKQIRATHANKPKSNIIRGA